MTRRNLPTSFDGALTPHMSRARLREQCDDVDAMLGGTERMVHEANRSPDAYWEFQKLRVKAMPKEVEQTHQLSTGMEALLKRVEERKKERQAEVVDAKFTVVEEHHAAQEQSDEGSAPVQHTGGDSRGEAD